MISIKYSTQCFTPIKATSLEQQAAHQILNTGKTGQIIRLADGLPFLWLQLDQNIYRQDSRAEATTPVTGGRFANKAFTQGDVIKAVTIIKNGKAEAAN